MSSGEQSSELSSMPTGASRKQAMKLGRGGAKRHRKILKDPISGITKPAIRRLCRRGGVKRINHAVYEGARSTMENFVYKVLNDSIIYMMHAKRKTIILSDVIHALKHRNIQLYSGN